MQTQLGVNADAVQSKSLTKPTKNSTQKIVKPINVSIYEVFHEMKILKVQFSIFISDTIFTRSRYSCQSIEYPILVDWIANTMVETFEFTS